MRQESPEKKIIEMLQQYSSPEPDPAFEARLKEQFLQKAREAKRKRTLFRGAGWTSAIAASVLIGTIIYQNPLEWQGNQGNQAQEKKEAPLKENFPTSVEVGSTWKPIDTNQLEVVEPAPAGKDGLALYMSTDRKKLYAVKEGRGLLIYQTGEMNVSIGKAYPFPNNPNLYYIWLAEDQEMEQSGPVKRVNHVFLIKNDAVSELKNIPQPGYNTNLKLEWSPSGKKAYLAIDNGQEWVVGELGEQELEFRPIYGAITEEAPLQTMPQKPMSWQAAWVNDSQVLVYNPLAEAFYGVDAETRSAWEYKAVMPQMPKGSYVKELFIPSGMEPQMAVFKIGNVILDASFSGTEHFYKINLNTQEISPIDPSIAVSKRKNYFDQYHLSEGDHGETPLIGTVYTSDQKQFRLRIGLYDLMKDRYESSYETAFEAPAYLHIGAVKLSPDGETIALRVLTTPPDGASQEYLCVFNRFTGEELTTPISKAFISNVEFMDNDTLKVDEQIVELN